MTTFELNETPKTRVNELPLIASENAIFGFLEERERIISALSECTNLLEKAYNSRVERPKEVRLLELKQRTLSQRLERVDKKICDFKPNNKSDRKAFLTALLDIYIYLNEIEGENAHLQLIRDNIKNL